MLPIQKRYNFVRLWESYRSAEDWYKSDSNPNRLASGASDARLQLFWAVHPPAKGQPTDKRSVNRDNKLRAKYGSFEKNLKNARRWWKVAKRLGYGALLLMQKSSISHRFITQELPEDLLDIWIELVLYVSPWVRPMGDIALHTLGPRVLFRQRPFETPLLLEQVSLEEILEGPDRYVDGPWMNLFAQMPPPEPGLERRAPKLGATRLECTDDRMEISTHPDRSTFDQQGRVYNTHFHESFEAVELRYTFDDDGSTRFLYL